MNLQGGSFNALLLATLRDKKIKTFFISKNWKGSSNAIGELLNKVAQYLCIPHTLLMTSKLQLASQSAITIGTFPSLQATCKGVLPCLSCKSTGHPWLMRLLTTSIWHLLTARCRAIWPSWNHKTARKQDLIMLKTKAFCRVTIISLKWVRLLASRITVVLIFVLRVEAGRCTVSVWTNQLWDESKFLLSYWALQWNGWNANTHSPLMTSLGGGRVTNCDNQLNIVNHPCVYWQKLVMQMSFNLLSDQ